MAAAGHKSGFELTKRTHITGGLWGARCWDLGKIAYNMITSCMNIFMVTSSNGNISVLLAICAGNSPVTGESPSKRPGTRSFDVSFDLRLNKRLSKQSWGWWFETLLRPLRRHCNLHSITYWGPMTHGWVISSLAEIMTPGTRPLS